MGELASLARTLDQELLAILRRASLECLVCGEFLQYRPDGTIICSECGSGLRGGEAQSGALHSSSQAG